MNKKIQGYRFFISLVFFVIIIVFYHIVNSYFSNIQDINYSSKYSKTKELSYYSIDDYEWQKLCERLREISDLYSGKVGIYLKDLKTNKVWEYNADRLFRSASLIKLPIMVGVMDAIKRKEASLDEELVITSKERMDGSGSLKWARDGTRITLLEAIYRMITESDNTATKLVIDRFGFEYFNNYFRQIGLAYTNITIEGMSLTSGRVARENYTTPREMGLLLEKIYKKELVSEDMSEMMLDILKRNKSHSRIRKGIPVSWQVGHKTGLLRKSCSDVGIVFSPKGDYILAVLLDGVPSYRSGKDFIAKIAKITSDFYKI